MYVLTNAIIIKSYAVIKTMLPDLKKRAGMN